MMMPKKICSYFALVCQGQFEIADVMDLSTERL